MTTRATTVKNLIARCCDAIDKKQVELGKLLLEVRDNRFFVDYGFKTFTDYVQGTNWPFGWRQAYDLCNIADKASKASLPTEQLIAADISKLKQVARLDPAKHGAEMRTLTQKAANNEPLTAIKDSVDRLLGKTKPLGEDLTSSSVSFNVSKDTAATVDRALTLAQATGAKTRGEAIAAICAFYIAACQPRVPAQNGARLAS